MRDELLGYERSQSEAFVPVDELFKLAASPTNKTSQENDERPLDHTELDIHDDCILSFFFSFSLGENNIEIEAFPLCFIYAYPV